MLLSVTGMLVDLSVTIMQVTISVAVMQLDVSAAHMQMTVETMQVVFSAVHYAHDCVYCNYAGNFPL